jgi:hypothetical protein
MSSSIDNVVSSVISRWFQPQLLLVSPALQHRPQVGNNFTPHALKLDVRNDYLPLIQIKILDGIGLSD